MNIIVDLGWVLYRLNLGVGGEKPNYDAWDDLMNERDNLKFRSQKDLENQ